MNDLGLILLGGLMRGLLFAALGVVLYVVTRRLGPSARSVTALATLTGLVALLGLSLSPWPRWHSLGLEARNQAPSPAVAVPAAARPASDAKQGVSDAHTSAQSVRPADSGLMFSTFLRGLIENLRHPTVADKPDRPAPWHWTAWVALGLIGFAAVGLVRWGVGLGAVMWLRRKSRPVRDASLLDEVSILRAESSCVRPVELRDSDVISAPATIGWRRAVILLPADWTTWEEAERRAVLTHELAHVIRGDYPAMLWAQFCLALNLFNPLAHWLLGRLRLEQELAADAVGAEFLGGNRPYLMALANLALRCDQHPATWPARAFLPGRDTFLRRIQMLRDSSDSTSRPASRWGRAIVVAFLLGSGLAVAGLRGPDAPTTVRAQEEPVVRNEPNSKTDKSGLDLSAVPSDAWAVLTGKPVESSKIPGLEPIREWLNSVPDPYPVRYVPTNRIAQLTLVWLPEAAWSERGPAERIPGPQVVVTVERLPDPQVVITRVLDPGDWKPVLPPPEQVEHAGQTYYRETGNTGHCWFEVDDRTRVVGLNEEGLKAYLSARKKPDQGHGWDDAWRQVDKGQLVLAIDSSVLNKRITPRIGPDGVLVAPLWTQTHAMALSLNLRDGIDIDAIALSEKGQNAEQVEKTAQALLTLASNFVEGIKTQMAQRKAMPGAHSYGLPPDPIEAARPMYELASTLLDKARVVRDGQSVRLKSHSDVKVGDLLRSLSGPVAAARASGRRVQSISNLRQIGLALIMYADAHDGRFPPAVLLGPDGKTPYSWRVAILPYLDQQALHDEYHFDEPWDGPRNIKLLEKVPPSYRHPTEAGPNSSYFVLTGPDTLFGMPGGTKIPSVTDGCFATLMVVEAKRDVPWTRPEDIPFDPNGAPPTLGGYAPEGSVAAFADGSVRSLPSTIKPEDLKALITRNGGEKVDLDKIFPLPTTRTAQP